MSAEIDRLLSAASFAARAHRHQLRKDGQTPYIAHPFRVCLIVRHVFGIDDADFLATALLHDTLEDTTTDFDDLQEAFGRNVAHHVADLSKDTRLPDATREAAYTQTLAKAPPAVKIAKLADIYDNLRDSRNLSSSQRAGVIRRSEMYLPALERDLPAVAVLPLQMVRSLLQELSDADSGNDRE